MVNDIVMSKVNVFEIKAKLSEYLERAAGGERIVIYRHNTPIAELRAVEERRTEPRPVGPLPGRPTFDLPSSFFEPLPEEELDQWYGVAATDPLSPSWKPQAPSGVRRAGAAPANVRRAGSAQADPPATRGGQRGRRRRS